MTKHARTAIAVIALLLVMSLPAPPNTLEEKNSPYAVSPASDMIADFSLNIASSSSIVALDHIGQTYVVALQHDGAGSVGAFTWGGQMAGGALLTIAHNGSVVDSVFTTVSPVDMRASSSTIVVLADHTQTGIVMDAYDAQLNHLNTKILQSSTTGGSAGDLTTHAMDLDASNVYATFSCPAGSEMTFLSQTCTTSTGRHSLTTVSWNTTTNALSSMAVAKWFTPESTWMNYLPAETGGGFTTIGPNQIGRAHV